MHDSPPFPDTSSSHQGSLATTQGLHSPPLPFTFTGTGSEYFRIWIVNLLLSILTLGIYSAWAKVRRLQYIYRNTQLDGSPFDYHGDPIAILKGRAIVFGLLLLNHLSGGLHPLVAAFGSILLALAMPWLMLCSLRFRMRNSSYRSLRFAFHGSYREAIRLFWGWPILLLVTLWTTLPLWLQRLKKFQVGNTQYAEMRFNFHATGKQYYGVFLQLAGLAVLPFVLLGSAIFMLAIAPDAMAGSSATAAIFLLIAAALTYLIVLVMTRPFYLAKMQNLVWNHTTLGTHRFLSQARVRQLIGIILSNTILTVLTLGLYFPFAQIRLVKYRLEALQFQPEGSLDNFITEQQRDGTALGEEAVDWFDFDLSL